MASLVRLSLLEVLVGLLNIEVLVRRDETRTPILEIFNKGRNTTGAIEVGRGESSRVGEVVSTLRYHLIPDDM